MLDVLLLDLAHGKQPVLVDVRGGVLGEVVDHPPESQRTGVELVVVRRRQRPGAGVASAQATFAGTRA